MPLLARDEEDRELRAVRLDDDPLLADLERVAELPPFADLTTVREPPVPDDLPPDFFAADLRAPVDLEAAFLAGLLADFLAPDFLAADFFAVAFLAVDFFAVALWEPDFLAVVFLAALRLVPAFLAVLLRAAFLAEVFFAADFLAAPREPLIAALFEPPRDDLDAVRLFEAALLRPAEPDFDLPPALFEEVFLEAAFLADFAIVNGF